MDNFLNDSVSNGKTADAESRKLIYILIFKLLKIGQQQCGKILSLITCLQ